MNTITKEGFQEKFGDMMLHGLDSTSTYIPLRTSARYGINVAIRPMVLRVSDGVVLFGGKLRVGYTLDEKHRPVKTPVTEISEEVMVKRLQEFCKGFSWQKGGPKRFSTVIGIGVAATRFDKEKVTDYMIENNVAADFIARIERTYKQYNGVGFGNAKGAAIEAMREAWVLQSDNARIFGDKFEFTPLPETVVGKQTALLNKAQDKYKDTVVSFADKVKELAAKAEAKAATSEE